ncbi:hypothetical protein FB451DRAFT_1222273 [Mycena latifolia]|nr:hypothetical protein FB451DRAFT_1222273 [Mycena latifolia]
MALLTKPDLLTRATPLPPGAAPHLHQALPLSAVAPSSRGPRDLFLDTRPPRCLSPTLASLAGLNRSAGETDRLGSRTSLRHRFAPLSSPRPCLAGVRQPTTTAAASMTRPTPTPSPPPGRTATFLSDWSWTGERLVVVVLAFVVVRRRPPGSHSPFRLFAPDAHRHHPVHHPLPSPPQTLISPPAPQLVGV